LSQPARRAAKVYFTGILNCLSACEFEGYRSDTNNLPVLSDVRFTALNDVSVLLGLRLTALNVSVLLGLRLTALNVSVLLGLRLTTLNMSVLLGLRLTALNVSVLLGLRLTALNMTVLLGLRLTALNVSVLLGCEAHRTEWRASSCGISG
jgi:hypothetical protein